MDRCNLDGSTNRRTCVAYYCMYRKEGIKLVFMGWPCLFFISGLIFFISFQYQVRFRFFSLFGSMISLLALVFVLPFMSTIISVGKYDRALGQLINRPPPLNMNRLYRRTSVMTYLLTLFFKCCNGACCCGNGKRTIGVAKRCCDSTFFLLIVFYEHMHWCFYGARLKCL